MFKDFQYETIEAGWDQLLGSPGLAQAMVDVGTPILAEAQNTAPKNTTAFSKGFRIKPSLVPAGRRGELRAGAVIYNDVPYARYVMNKATGRSFMYSLGQKIEGETR